MPRPLDPAVDQALEVATIELLSEVGFAGMTIEAVAAAAGVGKPAIYRRHSDKAALVAAVIAGRLPTLTVPDLGDTRAELWQAVELGFPEDGAAYVGLIGGLMAEHRRHPELIEAFRRSVLGPRRAVGLALVTRGQERGDIRERPRTGDDGGPVRRPFPRPRLRRRGHRPGLAPEGLRRLVDPRQGAR